MQDIMTEGLGMNMMYDPNMYNNYGYGYTPVGYNTIPTPVNKASLNAEELQRIRNVNGNRKQLSLAVEDVDVLRVCCNHKNENGVDLVQPVNDGSGDVYCPQCGYRWNPDMMTKEEVMELVDKLLNQMQNSKWVGDFGREFIREFYAIMAILPKYPDIHEYAMNTINKYYNANNMYTAQDANVYGAYNSLLNNVGYYATPQQMTSGYYGQPIPPQTGYYGQPQAPQTPAGYYGQAQPFGQTPSYGTPQPANPMFNPMQAPAGYGVNPAAPNQQFTQQANMMMGGSVYPQTPAGSYGTAQAYGQAPAAPVTNPQQPPLFGAPQPQQPTGPVQPVGAPQQTPGGSTITPQDDGTVKSEKKIEL